MIPINNIVFKGTDFTEMGNSVEIIEETEFIKVYIECMVFMEGKVDEQITCLKNMLSKTTDIGFSDGIKDHFIPYFKNLMHIANHDLGFKVTHDKTLTYKVMAVFRYKAGASFEIKGKSNFEWVKLTEQQIDDKF